MIFFFPETMWRLDFYYDDLRFSYLVAVTKGPKSNVNDFIWLWWLRWIFLQKVNYIWLSTFKCYQLSANTLRWLILCQFWRPYVCIRLKSLNYNELNYLYLLLTFFQFDDTAMQVTPWISWGFLVLLSLRFWRMELILIFAFRPIKIMALLP